MKALFIRRSAFAFLFVPLVLFSACDNPVGHDHDDHAEFEVIQVMLNGQQVLSYDVEEGGLTGSFTVQNGQTLGPFTVRLLDHDGKDVSGELHDDEFSLAVDVGSTMATATVTGPWTFTLTGNQVGATTITIRILHEGHDDAKTPAIPLVVTV